MSLDVLVPEVYRNTIYIGKSAMNDPQNDKTGQSIAVKVILDRDTKIIAQRLLDTLFSEVRLRDASDGMNASVVINALARMVFAIAGGPFGLSLEQAEQIRHDVLAVFAKHIDGKMVKNKDATDN